jgi:2-polyprenyl-3-methyl-5-hydroxy-6-metoxy-1,4-benzoquinol methylase
MSTETTVPQDAARAAQLVPKDLRLGPEFMRRLQRYMGEYDPKSPFASIYYEWYQDHAGERSAWFRNDLVWRLESTRPLAGLRVLDFGCGTGSSSVVMAERGASVVGIETEAVSIAMAVQRARDVGMADRCSFVRIPYIEDRRAFLPFRNAAFDVVTLIGVLEHMKPNERVDCAAEIARVLAPGGELFVFDTPNRAHPFDRHTTRLWFVGWMPVAIARRYAIARNRFEARKDFARYGGTGITRRVIDALFPAPAWTVTYEKTPEQVAEEFGWLGKQMSLLPASWRDWGGRMLWKTTTPVMKAIQSCGFRATWWTASHALTLRKMPDSRG